MSEDSWLARVLSILNKKLDSALSFLDRIEDRICIVVKAFAAQTILIQQLSDKQEVDHQLLLQVLSELKPLAIPTHMELQFQGGEIGMPGKETDTQTIPCSAIETDAAGNPVTLNPANVTWAIDDTTIATLTQNTDGSATFKALKVGVANVSCTDNSTTPPLVGTDTLEVTSGAGSKLVLQFGTAA